MNDIAGKILGTSTKTSYLLANFHSISVTLFVLDVIIVSVLFYWVYVFLRETRAMRILYGLALLLLLMGVGRLLNLSLLNWILQYLMTMLVVAIPIVFQPELRTALEKLGRAKFIGEIILSKNGKSRTVDQIVLATSLLSKQRIGGLIVLQRQTGLREYIENGTEIDASVSKDILLSIFYPKSPLHDGAVIISGNKIISARSVLPVSEIYTASDIGTRHRAGVGITENSDAVSVVVSEETGSVSLAVGGKIERRLSEERLKNRLEELIVAK